MDGDHQSSVVRPARYRGACARMGFAQFKFKIMQPDHRHDNAQPQSIASCLHLITTAVKTIEHSHPFSLPDSWAGIDNIDLRPVFPTYKLHHDMPASRGKFDCIIQQIGDCLDRKSVV